MKPKVYIDGKDGTTGLQIYDRLAARDDIDLLLIDEAKQEGPGRTETADGGSDHRVFVPAGRGGCGGRGPGGGLRRRMIDASTAHRTAPGWVYGFPELRGQKQRIQQSCRVAVPGCYASGFIALARPLVELGLVPPGYPFSCTGLSGYSGGGKKMIAAYESPARPCPAPLDAPKSYGLGLDHKHLPEMQAVSGLTRPPLFVPVVCDYYSGMQVLLPLDLGLAGTSAQAVAQGLAAYYQGAAAVSVHSLNEPLPQNGLYSNALSGTDRMELYLNTNPAGDQMMLAALFDNLGKGSSGAAVQCMDLMLGFAETAGLEL